LALRFGVERHARLSIQGLGSEASIT
jgi:hypothetical protein